MANSELHIAAGEWELEAQPARGGAVTALRHRGRSVLVSPDCATPDAMGAASFALLPYANRIAHGRLDFQGRQWILPPNFGQHAHPLHGTGWKRPWAVAAAHADSIDLRLQHLADVHWPWNFTALQRLCLRADAVRFEMEVTNLADEPAPMGVGFHPAFAACDVTRLRTQMDGVWLTDEDSLPRLHASAVQVLPELPAALPVLRPVLVDHCFTGWSRELWLENAGTRGELVAVQLTASPAMSYLQLYMPPGKRWFCAEPMTQMPDAVHHAAPGNGLRLLQSGETLRAWMQIAVRDQAHGNPW